MNKAHITTLSTAAAFAALFGAAVPAALAQSAEDGEKLFRQCRACHQVGDTAKNLVGPQLNKIIGRKAGSIEGFNYSQASKDAGAKGLVWTDDNILAYLAGPAAFMPGTKMAYAGLKEENDRKDVLAYLKTFSK